MCLYKAHLRVCIICCWIAVFHSCVLSSPRLHHWELLATLWQAATNKPSWYWIMACCRTLKCCWDTLALIYRRWEWETSLGSMLHQLIESHRLQQTAWAAYKIINLTRSRKPGIRLHLRRWNYQLTRSLTKALIVHMYCHMSTFVLYVVSHTAGAVHVDPLHCPRRLHGLYQTSQLDSRTRYRLSLTVVWYLPWSMSSSK